MAFNSPITISGQQIWSSSSTQVHELGAKAYGPGGTVFRYAKAGAALTAGDLLQGPATVPNHLTLTPTAAAIGATTVTMTLGNTEATANQYANGFLNISGTPGNGYCYRIKSHPAANAAASLTVTLYDEDALRVAITASSTVDLVLNPYSGVLQSIVTTITAPVVGAAKYPIASGEYGWIQTGGPASILNSGTSAVGTLMMAPAGTAGMALIYAVASGKHPIGYLMSVGVNAAHKMIFLTLDN